MSTLAIQKPAKEDQHAFNLRRWAEISEDPFYADLPERIETDRNGKIIMSPSPFLPHSRKGSRLVRLLNSHLPNGEAMHEIPISTSDGVRAADVAWLSPPQMIQSERCNVLPFAPEICIEVLSPSSTEREMQEKSALYFDAGATEVWLCDLDGSLRFFSAPGDQIPQSKLAPDFPLSI